MYVYFKCIKVLEVYIWLIHNNVSSAQSNISKANVSQWCTLKPLGIWYFAAIFWTTYQHISQGTRLVFHCQVLEQNTWQHWVITNTRIVRFVIEMFWLNISMFKTFSRILMKSLILCGSFRPLFKTMNSYQPHCDIVLLELLLCCVTALKLH